MNVNKLTRIENFKKFIIILLLTEKLGGLLNKKIQIFIRISIERNTIKFRYTIYKLYNSALMNIRKIDFCSDSNT